MKTIEDAAGHYANSCLYNDCITEREESFKAGAEFAQRWIPVDEELPEIGEQVLAKKELRHGDTWVQNFYSIVTRMTPSGEWEGVEWSDVGHTRGIVTHWRLIELK